MFGTGSVSEAVAYWADPKNNLIDWIISTGHRNGIFDPLNVQGGCAIGPHTKYSAVACCTWSKKYVPK